MNREELKKQIEESLPNYHLYFVTGNSAQWYLCLTPDCKTTFRVFVFEWLKPEIDLRIVTGALNKNLEEYKSIVRKLSSALKMKVMVSAGDKIRRANVIYSSSWDSLGMNPNQ